MDNAFLLRKWYFDCIDSDGRLIIAYVAQVHWMSLHIHYSAALRYDGSVTALSSIKKINLPEYNDGVLQYKNHLFDVDLISSAKPLIRTLHDSDDGNIKWRCHYPASTISIATKDLTVNGNGYAEELVMMIKPWEMKIKTIRWGRFIAENIYITWIEWCGEWDRFSVWMNGEEFTSGTITESRLTFDKFELCFDDSKVLRSGSLLSTVFSKIPLFKKVFPLKSLLTEEHKWVSQSRLLVNGGHVSTGYTIHELVVLG